MGVFFNVNEIEEVSAIRSHKISATANKSFPLYFVTFCIHSDFCISKSTDRQHKSAYGIIWTHINQIKCIWT